MVERRLKRKSHPDIRTVSSKFLYSCSDNLQHETLNSRKLGSRRKRLAVTTVRGTWVPCTSKIRRRFKGLTDIILSRKRSLRKLEKLPSKLKHSRFEEPRKEKVNYSAKLVMQRKNDLLLRTLKSNSSSHVWMGVSSTS